MEGDRLIANTRISKNGLNQTIIGYVVSSSLHVGYNFDCQLIYYAWSMVKQSYALGYIG